MAAPVVRDLNQLVSEYGRSVEPQKQLIDTDIANNEKSGQAQIEGLGAAKDRAFGKITQAAQNKGMLFSGFAPDAQAEYTASTYLPALAKLQAAIANTRTSLLGKKADIDKNVYDKAFATRESDISAKRSWDAAEAARAFQAAEAEKQREFQRQQAEQAYQRQLAMAREQRAWQAAQAARAVRGGGGGGVVYRGGGGGGGGGASPNIVERVRAMLQANTGRDGKVSPVVWRQVAAYAADNGLRFGGADGFASKMWQYANDSHWRDYRLGYDRYM